MKAEIVMMGICWWRSVVIGVQWQWRYDGIDVMVAVVVMALLLEVGRASLLVISIIHFCQN